MSKDHSRTADEGSVVTVDGRIDPVELGTTLTHEHLFVDIVDTHFEPPDSARERSIAREPVSLENLWYVRRNPGRHKDNMRLDDVDTAVDELARYRRHGGDAVVDVTPKNIGGDPTVVRAVARETGVTAVHGTAYYTRRSHTGHVDRSSVSELADEFVRDVREGIDGTDVRAGIVGEIGISGEIHEQEEKVLRAGARAARRTGAPLNVHPPGWEPDEHKGETYPSSRWGLDILDVVEEEGLPPERVVISHLDRPEFELDTLEYQREIADRGAFVEYDLWGAENYIDDAERGYPSDTQRIDAVTDLLADGYESHLLFSHNIAVKMLLTAYGGFGYSHVLENVVPMLRSAGVDRESIETILRDNPRRMLTFAEPN
jgi:phosphotriesterase-related protein